MPHGIGRSSKRMSGDGSPSVVAGDWTLGVGWGDGAVTKTVATGSTEQRGQIVITSVGSNQAQATATAVLTYPGGARPSAPVMVMLSTTNDNSIDTGHVTWSSTTTALTLTFSVLPVATKIYKINWLIPD